MPVSLPNVNELAARLERIRRLADELARRDLDVLDQRALATGFHREINAAMFALTSAGWGLVTVKTVRYTASAR
jgi:hypothetical protein